MSSFYLPKDDKEAKRLNEAYRTGKIIKLGEKRVRVTGMTRSVPPRYTLMPV